MGDPRKAVSGWALAEQSDQPTSLRSPQERNLLQFSPFVGLEEGPRSTTKGRFRRVQSRVSNRPALLTNLTSRQLSQMSSNESGEEVSISIPSPRTRVPPSLQKNQGLGVEDNDNEVATSSAENSASNTNENGGFSHSMTISLDHTVIQEKNSSIKPSSRRDISEVDLQSDMMASQISMQSKLRPSERGSADDIDGTGKEEQGIGNGLRSMTSSLSKKLSQDGRLIRKLSGLLSRTRTVSPSRPQAVAKRDAGERVRSQDAPDRNRARDIKAQPGLSARKASLRGLFGRKDKTPTRKRSFILSPRRTPGRTKSADFETIPRNRTERVVGDKYMEVSNRPLTEKDVIITAAIDDFRGDSFRDGGVTSTEDDLARRAVQIEKFLNSAEFL